MSQQGSTLTDEACAIIGTCLSDVAAGRLPPRTLIPAVSGDARAYMDDDHSVVWYPAKPLNLDTSIGLGAWSLTSATRVRPLQLPAVDHVFFCVFLPVEEGSAGGSTSSGFLPGTWQLVMESEGRLSKGSAALEAGPPAFLHQLQVKLQGLAAQGGYALLGLHVHEGSNYVDLYLLPPTILTAAAPSHHSSRNSLDVSRPLQSPTAVAMAPPPSWQAQGGDGGSQQQQQRRQDSLSAAASRSASIGSMGATSFGGIHPQALLIPSPPMEAVVAKPQDQEHGDTAAAGDVHQRLQRALQDNAALQQQLMQANSELELLRRQNQELSKLVRTKALRVTCLEQQVSAAEAKADAANTALQAEVAATATAAEAHRREVASSMQQMEALRAQHAAEVQYLQRQADGAARQSSGGVPAALRTRQSMEFSRSTLDSVSPTPGAAAGPPLSPAAAARAAASMMEQWHAVDSVRRSREYNSIGVTSVTRGYHSMDVPRSSSLYSSTSTSVIGAPGSSAGFGQAPLSAPRSFVDGSSGEDPQVGAGRAGSGGLARAPAVSAAVVASSSLFGPSMPLPSIPSSRAKYGSDGGVFGGIPSPRGP